VGFHGKNSIRSRSVRRGDLSRDIIAAAVPSKKTSSILVTYVTVAVLVTPPMLAPAGLGPHRDQFRDGIPRWPGTIGRSPPEASRPHARTSKWRLGSNRLGGSGHLLARRLTAECGSTLVLTRGGCQLRLSNIFGRPNRRTRGRGRNQGTSQTIRRRIVAISEGCVRSAIATRPNGSLELSVTCQ
jgi:hypothetical protein